MPDKKNGGGGGAKVGEIVLYQPTRLNWLRGGGQQLPALVHWVAGEDDEKGTANLVVFVTADCRDHVLNVTYGEADGQYMKQGEESKTAKLMKQAAEENKKASEERAKKEEERAKKIQQEAKEQKSQGGFPTTQTQLDADHRRAEMQYKYPQPPQEN